MAVKQTLNSLYSPDGSMYIVQTDGAGNLVSNSEYATPASAGAIVVASASGNVAAATATATLAGAAAKTTYISGYIFTYAGATAASVVTGTITGLVGGTHSFTVPVPAGVTIGAIPIVVDYNPPVPASAVNTPIVVSIPSLGTGNTNATVSAWGYQV